MLASCIQLTPAVGIFSMYVFSVVFSKLPYLCFVDCIEATSKAANTLYIIALFCIYHVNEWWFRVVATNVRGEMIFVARRFVFSGNAKRGIKESETHLQ